MVNHSRLLSYNGNAVHSGRVQDSRNFRNGTSTSLKDFINQNSTYPDNVFKRMFSIPLILPFTIKNDLIQHHKDFWKQQENGLGYKLTGTDLKMLAELRILSSGHSTDSLSYVDYIVRGFRSVKFSSVLH